MKIIIGAVAGLLVIGGISFFAYCSAHTQKENFYFFLGLVAILGAVVIMAVVNEVYKDRRSPAEKRAEDLEKVKDAYLKRRPENLDTSRIFQHYNNKNDDKFMKEYNEFVDKIIAEKKEEMFKHLLAFKFFSAVTHVNEVINNMKAQRLIKALAQQFGDLEKPLYGEMGCVIHRSLETIPGFMEWVRADKARHNSWGGEWI